VLGPGSVGQCADEVVKLGGENDAAALRQAAGGSFDVVLDLVCGAPMIATPKDTRWRACHCHRHRGWA
jgi:NADPH2:quinone reductase